MALKILTAKPATEDNGGDFEMPHEGTQFACLVAIIDLGTQTVTYQEQTSRKPKVYFGWELLEQKRRDGTCFILGQDYTVSLAGNSKLRPLIEGWTGKTFRDNEEFPYTLPASKGGLLGRYCMLNVEHATPKKGGDRKFAKIKSVSPLHKSSEQAAYRLRPQTTPFVWEIESDDLPPLADTVYLYGSPLADHIALAEERGGRRPARQPSHGGMVVGPEDAGTPAGTDDIPF